MKNIKSSDGVINATGKLGDSAHIVSPASVDFFDEIEDGIKSTVRCAIETGFETFSSCQGHVGCDSKYQQRTVTLILDNNELIFWQHMISDLNIVHQYKSPIEYHILARKDSRFDFMILIGSVYDLNETITKQNDLEKAILTIRTKYYTLKNHNYRNYTSKALHINEYF